MNLKHGYSSHHLYYTWTRIKQKCYNENHSRYKDWGGRGIKVCDEWMNPKTFIEWCLENGWKPGLQIDRRNNDGNYNPENCRFITQKENNHNKRLLMSTNKSGYRGVFYNYKKWAAQIYIDGKQSFLGRFDTPEIAATAYDKAIPDNRTRNFK